MRPSTFIRFGFSAGLACGLFGAGAMAPAPATAQSAIKVVVNSEPITTNEINQRARFLRLVARDMSGPALVNMATEELIEEKMKLQEAKRLKISANDAQVDQAFGAIASRVKLSPPQLVAALGQQGIDSGTLRQRLRAQIIWQQMVIGRFQRSVSISDSQVVDALEKQQKDGKAKTASATSNTSTEYTLNQILMVVPAKSPPGYLQTRVKEAEALRGKINGCEGLVDTVKGMKETLVKNVGRRTQDELPEGFRTVLDETPVGKATKPQQGGVGVEMLVVCAKRDVEGDFTVRTKVEQDLREQQGQVLTRQYISELRRIAVIEYK